MKNTVHYEFKCKYLKIRINLDLIPIALTSLTNYLTDGAGVKKTIGYDKTFAGEGACGGGRSATGRRALNSQWMYRGRGLGSWCNAVSNTMQGNKNKVHTF